MWNLRWTSMTHLLVWGPCEHSPGCAHKQLQIQSDGRQLGSPPRTDDPGKLCSQTALLQGNTSTAKESHRYYYYLQNSHQRNLKLKIILNLEIWLVQFTGERTEWSIFKNTLSGSNNSTIIPGKNNHSQSGAVLLPVSRSRTNYHSDF